MELKVLYFGMIAEVTNKSEEVITVPESYTIQELSSLLQKKYKSLQQLSFKIAIDQEICEASKLLKISNEVALLPPFSGG